MGEKEAKRNDGMIYNHNILEAIEYVGYDMDEAVKMYRMYYPGAVSSCGHGATSEMIAYLIVSMHRHHSNKY